jgi:hypothetical protein
MTIIAATSRRAVALLIVLAVLLLVTSATSMLVRAAAIRQLHDRADRASLIADEMLDAAAMPIHRWLRDISTTVVLSPRAEVPAIIILDDRWTAAGLEHELLVTAWDQCGMVSFDSIRRARPLRLAVPSNVLARIDSTRSALMARTGLDELPGADSLTHEAGPYPSSPTGAQVRDEQAIGAFISMHHPSAECINVNTAPMTLLEEAIRLAGRGGVESILAARRAGRTTSIGDLPVRTDRPPSQATIRLASASVAWGIRIDIRVGPIRRSWWAVYARQRRQRWECIHRVPILS